MSNIEITKPTNTQKASFKVLSKDNIQLQMIPQIFNYDIGFGKMDESLTGFMTANVLTINDQTYYSIQRKFYEQQSYTADDSSSSIIIPSSRFISGIGSSSAYNVIALSYKKIITKDGISNIKPEKNVLINLSSIAYSSSLSATLGFGVGGGKSIPYMLYDKRISSTAGEIIMKILKPLSNGLLSLSGTKVSDFRYDDSLVVGRIFYDYALIVLDSFQAYQVSEWTLSGDTYTHYIPYPIHNNFSDMSVPNYETNVNAGIPIMVSNFDNIIFNESSAPSGAFTYDFGEYGVATYSDIGSISGLFLSYNSPIDIIVIDDVNVDFKLNKNSYIINVPILRKDFNYSTNRLRNGSGENIIPEATEDNPIWFKKLGFYDYKHNLLGIANISIPVKKSNKRTMIVKIKIDY